MNKINEKSRHSSYELVKRAIEFKKPERVPYNFDENRTPEIETKYGDDFIWVFVDPADDFQPSEPGENEWKVVYETVDDSFGQAKTHPLSELKILDSYEFPDYALPNRYKSMEKRIKDNPDKYVLGMFPNFFLLTLIDLLGFENLMYSLIDKRSEIEKLMDNLLECCLTIVDSMADRGVNGIIAIEDLGVQDRLIIGPDILRELFIPRYAKVIERAHQRGLHVFFHTCGHILDIIEDFIDIGLDVIQIDQQDNMGIDNLAERYRGRICFFCPVDIQSVLIKPDNFSAIEDKVKQLINAFGSEDGGFMAKTYPQPEAIKIPEANTAYMCEMFKKYGAK